jgi:hypothetical protein
VFSYEAGLLVAFCLWLWITVAALVAINSRMERNLNRIGQRLSWLTLTPKPLSPEEIHHSALRKVAKFLLLYGTGLPFVLASWLYVAYVVALLIYRRSKDSGAPQAVREFRWKMRNVDMTFDQLVRELMKVSEQDPATFDQVKQELLNELQERGVRAG